MSIGISGTTEKPCNDETYALFADVTKYVEWIKKSVGSGFLLNFENSDADEDMDFDNRDTMWKDKEAFCEYKVDDGFVYVHFNEFLIII